MSETMLFAHFMWWEGRWQPQMHNATFARETHYHRSLTYPLSKAHPDNLMECAICATLAALLPPGPKEEH